MVVISVNIYLIKTEAGLEPRYKADYTTFSKLKSNVVYKAQISRPRNVLLHNKVFALLKLCIKNCREDSIWHEKDPRALLGAIQLELGFVEYIQKMNGEVLIIPEKINFDRMKQDRADKLYKGLVKVVVGILGVTEEEINKNLVF